MKPALPTSGYRTVVRETLRGLLEPRRAGPLLLVGLSMVATETVLSQSLRAGAVATVIVFVTAIGAPCGWRLWLEAPQSNADWFWGVIAYVTLGSGLLLAIVIGLVDLLDAKMFFVHRGTLPICLTLFIVAGWGVGRDISLEANVLRERARADALAKEAERSQLLAIRSNLDPHFLFNTLNAIAEWCHEDAGTAEAALLQLSAMLRSIFDGVREPTWPLTRELELIRALFDMHRLRDPQRFELEWQVPTPIPSVELPPLLLLPLAENAMKHGPAAGHAGTVHFSVRPKQGGVTVDLTNPGPFLGPREGGSGLPTLQRRLLVAYGASAKLSVKDDAGVTHVQLELPNSPEGSVAT